MSRSIHSTRRDLETAKRYDYADRERWDTRASAIDYALAKKRTIKWQVRRERAEGDTALPQVTASSLPIRVLDESRWVHYPASQDDIRAVLKLLPQGALDGLSGITLRLGDLEQSAEVESEPDPLTGRRGEEILPGVFVNGHYVGRYHARSAEIQIFAYVYDEGIPNRVMWELYLRLQMLATLVHELGHQHDFTRRTTRGRWLHDDSTKIEIHAERYEHDWVQEYVVPYLERAYPTDEQALRAWMDHHGGVSAPLSELAGDRRGTSKRGGILTQSLFGSQDALEELAKEVALGKPLTETRLRFAEMLRYMDRFDATLSIVERILSEEPDHLGTLTCQAITFERQGRHSEAGQVAERVLAADPDITDAWEVLVFACEAQHDWEGLLLATTRVLVADRLSVGVRRHALVRRARARAELGDLAKAESDLDAIPEGRFGGPLRQRIAALRAEISERRARADPPGS